MNEIHSEILQALRDRTQWEDRQRKFYQMRHHGLRRKTKPHPGASDAHFPLADSSIERLKPFFFQQLFATDTLAHFVPQRRDHLETATSASLWFDYQLKQRSNLEQEVLEAIDSMLNSGRSVLKVTWSHTKKQLDYTSVMPHHIIVPTSTDCLETADWLVHVKVFTEAAYKREKNLLNDEMTLAAIRERPDDGEERPDEVYQREGITRPTMGQIIVWEVYVRDGNSWQIHTYSPTQPEIMLREPFGLPYDHGLLPFVDFPAEVKDPGWYSPRGLTERVAVFEGALTKTLNEKMDAMSHFNRPVYLSDRDTPNASNFRMRPGQILPPGVRPAPMPQPPISFDVVMNQLREMAEQRISTPDFGLNQTLHQDRRTATEINAIGSLFQQSSDLRMRIFRMSLGRVYRMSWSLLVQYAERDMEFWYQDQLIEIPRDAIHGDYSITPSGSADGVNKALLFQRAISRFQMFNQDPFIDQGQLRISVLEADDAGLVKRLYRDPNIHQGQETEEQASEIAVMMLGFPAQADPSDDHQIHLQTLMGFIQQREQLGEQPQQHVLAVMMQHIQQHLELWKQEDPKAAGQFERQLKQLITAAAQQQQQVEQPQA